MIKQFEMDHTLKCHNLNWSEQQINRIGSEPTLHSLKLEHVIRIIKNAYA